LVDQKLLRFGHIFILSVVLTASGSSPVSLARLSEKYR
jgi:hypothetical protein